MVQRAQVSSLGRFRNTRGVVSTPSPHPNGYVRVSIHRKAHQLHRLIAIAFQLPRREGQTTVDHIDNDPSNNALSNLRWASRSEQIKHSYATNAGGFEFEFALPTEPERLDGEEWRDVP